MFYKILTQIAKLIVSLRYKVEVRGQENLNANTLHHKGGILFMPNHPAHMDPVLVFLWLWPTYRMRPLIVEYIFRSPLLAFANKIVRGLPIPNFEAGVNQLKLKKASESLQAIADGLKAGDNFVVYPSGRLKSTGKELLGGASAAHELLQECPNANVVLIRTTGLWGSSFSRAATGKSPDLVKTFLKGAWVLIKNLILFAPRRHVLIEMEPNPEDLPRNGQMRIDLNRYLESWYNRYPDQKGHIHESEPLTRVSYSFWHQDLLKIQNHHKKEGKLNGTKISDATRDKIYKEIRAILGSPELEVKPEQHLAFDLGMDSLNIAELSAFLAKRFDVAEVHPEDLETVAHLLELAETGKSSSNGKERVISHFAWPEEKRPDPAMSEARTIPEAFLEIAERMGDASACADDLMGVFSYKKLKKSALVLAQYFRTWEEDRVAVMLPASCGAWIVILALQLAGKTPVMLNWTLGPRYLEGMMEQSGAKGIISSWKFLDRLGNVQFGGCVDKFVLLEDVRKSLTFGMKLRGLFLSFCSARKVARAMQLSKIDEHDPAVILFTSGSEATPKGVPLSHKNILSNQRAGLQCITLDSTDTIYAILPPFHSFGFSVVGLLPLLFGVKVAFYPDPTDSFSLADGLRRWQITMFVGAPSFLRGLLNATKPEQATTVRYFVSGAEKMPEELFGKVRTLNPKAKLIEGYGITECSPILTITPFHLPPKGVGKFIPGVEVITIHPETLEPQSAHEEGELCVRGSNVFSGYLGNPRTPFIDIHGKQWYRTGDLGHVDDQGYLILSGRLKRFVKIGGEMISLGAVEEVLVKQLTSQGRISPDLASLAVCAIEKEDSRAQLILFSTTEIDREEANSILHQAGFSNLVKIFAVKQIEEIPLMGAGKTDYRNLQAQL